MILSPEKPLSAAGATFVLRGNLAPDGAVIKHTAAERRLLQHAGPAVVFRNYNDLEARIDDPLLPVTADSVLVLQDAGPLGAPGIVSSSSTHLLVRVVQWLMKSPLCGFHVEFQ